MSTEDFIAESQKRRCFETDGPWFSPDGGRCWVKGDTIYWEDGDITENRGIMRGLPYSDGGGEDYSLWSDAKRAEVRARYIADRKRRANDEKKRERELNKLVASARRKLTKDELSAVKCSGRDI